MSGSDRVLHGNTPSVVVIVACRACIVSNWLAIFVCLGSTFFSATDSRISDFQRQDYNILSYSGGKRDYSETPTIRYLLKRQKTYYTGICKIREKIENPSKITMYKEL